MPLFICVNIEYMSILDLFYKRTCVRCIFLCLGWFICDTIKIIFFRTDFIVTELSDVFSSNAVFLLNLFK